jgi:hypothetical protein
MEAEAVRDPDIHLMAAAGASFLAGSAGETQRPWGLGLGPFADLEIEKRAWNRLFVGVAARYQYTSWVGCSCSEVPRSHTPELLATAAFELSTRSTVHGPRLAVGLFWNVESRIDTPEGTPVTDRRASFYGPVVNVGYFVAAKKLGFFGGGGFQMLYDARRGNSLGNSGLFGMFAVVGCSFGGPLFSQ